MCVTFEQKTSEEIIIQTEYPKYIYDEWNPKKPLTKEVTKAKDKNEIVYGNAKRKNKSGAEKGPCTGIVCELNSIYFSWVFDLVSVR